MSYRILMWVPGLFWLFFFVKPPFRIEDNTPIFHGLYTGLQITAILTALEYFL